MGLIETLRFITLHPLNASNKFAGLRRYVGWQLSSRLAPGPICVPFVNGSQMAVVIELNGSGDRCGCDESALHDTTVGKGFVPCRYSPLERRLSRVEGKPLHRGNTMYTSNPERLQERVASSPDFQVLGRNV
jgi:hypothetical protein